MCVYIYIVYFIYALFNLCMVSLSIETHLYIIYIDTIQYLKKPASIYNYYNDNIIRIDHHYIIIVYV